MLQVPPQAEQKPAKALLLLGSAPLCSNGEGPGGLHEAEAAHEDIT